MARRFRHKLVLWVNDWDGVQAGWMPEATLETLKLSGEIQPQPLTEEQGAAVIRALSKKIKGGA